MIWELIKYGKELCKHDKLTREAVLEYSEVQFRKIIKYAYNNSKFYKNYYKANGIKYDDLDGIPIEQIPSIDKKMVRENFYDISVKEVNPCKVQEALKSQDLLPRVENYYLVHTSGSTGIPTNFMYSKKALMILESNFVRLSITGDNPVGIKDLPVKSLYIAPVGSGYACTALAIFGMQKYHCKSVVINAQKPLNEWIEIIKDYKPSYLSGYPSCINLVASLQEKGEINISPKKIITGGEPLSEELASYYKKVFNADIIDYYGCTESIFIGAGTTYYDGIYLYDDLNYLEVDDNNKLIITPLYNKEFPLIRYKLSDVVDGFNKEGYGNLPYTHINKVMGRSEELMWFINEDGKKDFLHPLFLDDLNVNGITKFQFVQKSKRFFKIKCVTVSYEDKQKQEENIRKQINIFLKNKKMRNLKYEIDFVKDIPVNKVTGKCKMVIKDFKDEY